MNILIYTGETQYGVFSLWVDQMKEELEKKNHSVILFDLTQEDSYGKLIEVVTTTVVDAVISYNGFGIELEAANESLYDITNSIFLAMYVDHPIYHMQRISQKVKNYIAVFIDKSHVQYVDKILPNHHTFKSLIPPSTAVDNKFFDTYDEYINKKDIDILFTGTYLGKPKKSWENNEGLPTEHFDKISQLLIEDEYMTLLQAVNQTLEDDNIIISQDFFKKYSFMLPDVMTYARAFKRDKLIINLCESGLAIMIYGKNWDILQKQYDNLDYKGIGSSKETNVLINRVKIVINNNTNFTQGAHERVFTAVSSGAVVFSDRSTYYDKIFKDEESMLFYDINTIDTDINKIKKYLQDDKALYNIALKAYTHYDKTQRWEHRVDDMLKLIKLNKVIQQIEI